ncbi:NAD(P)/FAD-dependent oxidoreductase [Microbacterium sp. NC79]|uniref:flavin-containing monooxygenase n=1 Tax=Microbacterium sp. NC79 TaxID=2851009 RepID=UPI001C2BAD85|nr:NAD(P)/FAD-dependent oxidoreductase [Microbacterium sp. NC79]MBV0893710.1 NAD(P)/FAD-dependent oxidoreductase [Microbacterium sp. NC79]
MTTTVDVLVIGAGFAGVYSTIHADRAGYSVLGIEAGSEVGGTWYWNRYPGARCDVESLDYSYSFDPELENEWRWSERYATQPEILRYFQFVADRFDVRRHYRFNERVTAAAWDEAAQRWSVTTDAGDTISAQWLIMATGSLSNPNLPDIAGRDSFAGETYLTAMWPEEAPDFTGKRVAVIGTGSSGVQSVPHFARQAAEVVVYQRSANYSVPAFNRELTDEEWEASRPTLAERRAISWAGGAGSPWNSHPVPFDEVPQDERDAVFAEAWERGGVLFGKAFAEQTVREDINDAARVYFEARLADIVTDPQTRSDLTPTDHAIGTKRICTDSGYYQTFNEEHVHLVNLRREPITEITADGIRTAEAMREHDVIVYATGFDALTGALSAINPIGRDGRSLAAEWADGPQTLLGLMVPGFPNMFTLNGPGSPSVLSNMALTSEQQGAWALRAIADATAAGHTSIEPRDDAAAAWTAHVVAVGDRTLFGNAPSWYTGANIAGKKRVFLPYLGGFANYTAQCTAAADKGYEGFVLSTASTAAVPASV